MTKYSVEYWIQLIRADYGSQMSNVKMGPVFKGHSAAAQKERLPPEGAGSSAYDSHAAPWTGFASSFPTPLTNSLLRSKLSKESLNGYPPEYNSIKSTGTKRETLFDTGHMCKKCISHFNVFKREALKQVTDENLSTKVSICLVSSICIHLETIVMHFLGWCLEDCCMHVHPISSLSHISITYEAHAFFPFPWNEFKSISFCSWSVIHVTLV